MGVGNAVRRGRETSIVCDWAYQGGFDSVLGAVVDDALDNCGCECGAISKLEGLGEGGVEADAIRQVQCRASPRDEERFRGLGFVCCGGLELEDDKGGEGMDVR